MFNPALAASVMRNEPFNPQQVIDEVLIPCSDVFHNADGDEESPLSDQQYDYINRLTKAAAPAHGFFTGIGATVRGGKITLPYQMGSLDQVEIGLLKQWIKDCGLSPDDTVVIMAKMDGSSGMAILNKEAVLNIAYSRGNGIEGADITRHLKHIIKNLDKTFVSTDTPVRGENIIKIQTFKEQNGKTMKRSGGQPYKNPRNAVSGMMNASETAVEAYPFIDFVAYQRLDRDDMDKEDQLIELEDMGFMVPWYDVVKVKDLTEELLATIIDTLRDTYDYEVDGVVVEVNSATIRNKLNPTALNPGYAMKYKTTGGDNYVETEVVEVEWNPSKHGYGKPRVIVKAAALPGITWTYATGYNAKWIVDNGIGPGAIVGGSRMGDVVPNIVRIIKSVKPQMPEGTYEWNETGVDIIMTGDDVLETVLMRQLTETARSLDIDGLRDGTAQKIVESGGYETFNEMFSAIAAWPRNWWVDLIGANGGKIYDDFHSKMSGVPLSVWLGSVPHFGRGVGKRKMKKLCEGLDIKTLEDFNVITHKQIASVEGFADKTAYKVMAGMDDHAELWAKVEAIIGFKQKETTGAKLAGQKVCLTGFRDKGIEAFIEKEGGEVQSGASAKTTILVAADLKESSTKIKKARDLIASGKANIQMMELAEFRKTYIEQKLTTGIEF